METWCPFAIKRLITTKEYFFPREYSVISIVDHITDGTDSRDLLQNSNNGSSVHFLIRVENGLGVIYQFMPLEWAAWGNGIFSLNNPYSPTWVKDCISKGININRKTISIEHERKYPFTTSLPMPMLEATIKLHKWIASAVPTLICDREYVIGHYQIDHVRKANCPGGPGGKLFPFDTIIATMNTSMPTAFWLPGASHPITNPDFIAFYKAEPKALQYWGLPIEDQKQEKLSDGQVYTVQYFERARFEWHGPQNVQLGLIGLELRQRG